jgi:hypothetical protein
MPEKNPVAFVVVGSAPIHESDPVNELAEIRIVRALARGSGSLKVIGPIRDEQVPSLRKLKITCDLRVYGDLVYLRRCPGGLVCIHDKSFHGSRIGFRRKWRRV